MAPAPLAGKPPFATDEPDSFYESSPAPQRRIRQPAPPNPNDRTSAYNVYDNYLTGSNKSDGAATRQSGVGAVGMGLLNMDLDSDNDMDDDQPPSSPFASKNAALAAATGVKSRSPPSPPRTPSPKQEPQTISQPQPMRQLHQPNIAAPRPGYAAPISALNLAQAEVEKPRIPPPQPIRVSPPAQNPFDDSRVFVPGVGSIPVNPSPSLPSNTSSPHPLQPPITPITPVFARPTKSPAITFSEPKPIIRGDTEGTLLPRRGERGDDFWRRFSMVAKIENTKPPGSKESWWLRKTQNGSTRLSRWVWVIALVLVICIVGASVIGYYASRNKPSHQPPKAFGGSANERPVSADSEAPKDAASTSSNKHVTPTHTVARREIAVTAVPMEHHRSHRRRQLFDAVVAH